MAGSPQKRARREAEQRGAVGIPLGPRAGAPADAHDARAPASRAYAPPAPARVRGVAPGPGVRKVADEHTTNAVQQFADALQPGTVVRVERLRPTWCAGWVGDLDLDRAGYAELMQHIHDQWGGQHYKLSAMGTNDAVLMETRQAIAGPPKDAGRFIDRDKYERAMNGEPLQPPPQQQQTAPAVDPVDTAIRLIQAIRGDSNNDAAAVAKLEAKLDQLSERLQNGNATPAETASLKSQLGELASGLSALEEIKSTIADTLPAGVVEPREEDTPLGALASRIGADIVAKHLNLSGDEKPTDPPHVSPPNGHAPGAPSIPKAR